MKEYRVFGYYFSKGKKCPFDMQVLADDAKTAQFIAVGHCCVFENINGCDFTLGETFVELIK